MGEHSKKFKDLSNWVFPNKKNNQPMDIRSAWEHALKRSNIVNFRFHDLRHSAASCLAMNGATSVEIAALLGHKTLQMVKRYSHLSECQIANIVEKMNYSIFGDKR